TCRAAASPDWSWSRRSWTGSKGSNSCSSGPATWSGTRSCRTSWRPTAPMASAVRGVVAGRDRRPVRAEAASAPMSGETGPKRSAAGPRVLVSDRQGEPIDLGDLAALAARNLEAEGRGDVELSLSFVTAGEMQDLHVRFMDESGPTDMLSFQLNK